MNSTGLPLQDPASPPGRRRRRLRQLPLAGALVALLAAGGLVASAAPADAVGSTLATETFQGSSTADARWIGLGDACLTGATATTASGVLGRCAKSNQSPTIGATPGYLQLTDASGSSAGAALYDRAIPSAGGLQVDYEEEQYGGSVDADGIAFFLSDGSYSLTSPGAYGGGLGYASLGAQAGITHAYLGLGLDAFGTFSSRNGAGGSDCPTTGTSGGGNSVTLRGPGTGTAGYCLLATKNVGTVVPGANIAWSTRAQAKQLVRITVSPTTIAAPNPTVTYSIDFTGTGATYTPIDSVQMPSPPPSTYKIGFTGSTGLFTDVHLVRNVSVQSVNALGAINLVKSVDRTTGTGTTKAAFTTGDRIPYQFLVTNTGIDPLTAISVTDPRITTVTCPSTTLAAADSERCTGSYVVTAADAAAGTLTNTATANGNDMGTPVTSSSSTTAPTYRASLSLVKSASPSTVTAAGQTVSYSFLVTNTGTAPATGVGIAETAFTGTGTAPAVSCPVSAATLAPGAQTTCTASYTATQADVDAGGIGNTAHATGTVVGGAIVSPDATAQVTATELPALTLVKTAQSGPLTAPGQTVTYSFLVTNTGNVAVKALSVTETAFSGSGTAPVPSCPVATLAAGAHTTCTATYTTTQADIDAGSVSNRATAAATTNRTNQPVSSAASDATASTTRTPQVDLGITANPTTVTAAGQNVTFSLVVTNTGNTSLTGVGATEGAFTGTGQPGPVTCPSTALAPGVSETCTVAYTTTQADVEHGSVSLSATSSGTSGGATVTSPTRQAQVTATRAPALTIAPTATPTTVNAAGDHVGYVFTVQNTGNVAVTGLTIDPRSFTGSGTVGAITCAATTLAVGASTTCTAGYSTTQDDVDQGAFTETVRATGGSVAGPAVSANGAVTVHALQAPALSITQTTDPGSFTAPGQSIGWDVVVTNTGNTRLTGLGVTEQGYTGSSQQSAVTCPVATLAPGASTTCTATSNSSQADIEAGGISATAVARATAPSSPVVSAPAGATANAVSLPALSLVSTITPVFHAAGDQVTITDTVANTGNRVITGTGIAIGAFSGTGSHGTPVCAASSLAPGATTTCTLTYTVTQADVDAGVLTSTAKATGATAQGASVASAASSVSTGRSGGGALSVAETASPSTVTAAGQQVQFIWMVANTGAVTATQVGLDEGAFTGSGHLGAVHCAAGVLAPGATTVCTADYTVTSADVDAGSVSASGAATGVIDGAPARTATATATVTATTLPAIGLTAGVDRATVTSAGQEVRFRFTVTDSGNTTLGQVAVAPGAFTGSGRLGAVTCPSATLAAGASEVCESAYTVTQHDLDQGEVSLTATASGRSGSATVTSPAATALTGVQVQRSLTIGQTASTDRLTRAGQHVVFTVTVRNSGDQTLTGLTVGTVRFTGTGRLGTPVCSVTTLAPGLSTVCRIAYTASAADLRHGSLTLVSTAAATGADRTRIRSTTATSMVAPVVNAPAPAHHKAGTGALAETGSAIAWPVGVGLALLIAGGGVLLLRRRRTM